ncbi:MAG TPA: phospholipid carrier-dependent glycosyltransferase [Candidatus Eremiobacteraceae bacterium]|nr:phospholipid carrier-dependent glycosyltransferase [Candidatus Eremiobacteraceae bacterium]
MSRRPQSSVATSTDAVAEDKPSRGLPLARKEILAVLFVTLLALIIRAILLPAPGHYTDVATFEAWMHTLAQDGPKAFYANAGFVDYPPGYMLILWIVGLIYHATAQYSDFSGEAMRVFVKLPGVICDLFIGYLVYLIARRSWPVAGAIVAMAVFSLNPASWLVSAYWGQADSVAAVFLVWAIYLAVTKRFEFAWLMIAFAVLIKPQPLVVAPLFLIWQIRMQGLTWRLALIPVIGFAVAFFGSLPFAPVSDPVGVISWLYDRYHAGITVYPYNSVNALNLYSINRDFYQPDDQPIQFFGLDLGPQYAWGMGIFIALLCAVGWRLWRTLGETKDDDGRELTFYTACFVVALGFFMVVTRQHERYLFTALAIVPLLWNASPVLRLATVVLSATFSYNLFYALQYLASPSQDLNPYLVHPISFINFAMLVLVAGSFLIDEVGVWANARLAAFGGASEEESAVQVRRRRGPNPFEGLAGWTPRDVAIAAVLTIGTGILLFWNVTFPPARIFDEIYYARAAQEYLHGQSLYEWTHPPLTKLIVAFGAWLFGPPHGKFVDPFGARMANCIMGTLWIPLIYAFAKRLFASTAGAVISVVLLVASGYYYVQSRIATPEISVAFFALLTLYCFYRYWIASQVVAVDEAPRYPRLETGLAAFGVVLALIILIYAEVAVYNGQHWNQTFIPYAIAVVTFSTAVAIWSSRYRRARVKKTGVVYPDGSMTDGQNVQFASGESKPLKSSSIVDGTTKVTWQQSGVEFVDGADRVVWRSDGTIEGTVGGQQVKERQRWGLWLALSALSLACFISSKWDGLFALAALWAIMAAVYLQQFFAARKRTPKAAGSEPVRFAWGNPLGSRLPLYLSTTIAVVLVFYVLTYLPNWTGAISTGTAMINQGGFSGLLSLQYQMYHYHATLTATHIYSSRWWTWPLELRPVSYYYDPGTGKPPDQIVGEIVSIANPGVWWAGIITVPWAAYLAWRERHKGIALLIIAYLAQWLPWSLSPRIDFLYNFFPNLAVICLCSTYVMLNIWRRASEAGPTTRNWAAAGIGAYVLLCIGLFFYFLPIWNGTPIPWQAWESRMWIQGPIVHGWI